MTVELPKDADGREIPLDTKVLYDECGNKYEVSRYCCSVRQSIPERVWDAVMLDSLTYYTSRLYLTPPDSWEKLEEDLRRAERHEDTASCCRYFTADKCADCRIKGYASDCIYIEERAFGDILDRICKLRGED